MAISFKVDLRGLNKLVGVSKDLPDQIVTQAFYKFRQETPIRTGNARANTSVDRGSKTINADYNYAGKLDSGWSKQSPNGMSTPTIDYVEKLVDKEIRKINGI
jgi:hypothetical protein